VAKEWARAFYDSAAWRRQRDAYRMRVHGICELCGEPGEIVHHRRELTPVTVHDPKETLGFDNLQLLCRDCHARAHEEIIGRPKAKETGEGLRFNARGELVRVGVPPGGESVEGARHRKAESSREPTGHA